MRPISVNVDEAVTIDWDQIKDFFLPGSVILQAIPATSPEVVGAPTGPPMLTTLDSMDFNEIDALSSYSPEVYDISHEWSANGDTPELIMVGDPTLVSTVTNSKDQRTEENTDHTKIVVLSDTNKKRGKIAITDKTGAKDAKATYDFFNKIEAVLEFNPYRFVQGSDGNQTCWNEIVSELGKKNIVTTKRNLQVFLCNHLKEHREKFKLLSGIEEPTMSDRDRLLADIDEIKQNQKKTSKDESAKLEEEATRRRLRVGMQPGLKITKIYEAEKSASVIEESDYVNRFKKTSKEKLISDSDLGTPTANEEGNYNFKIKRDAVLRIGKKVLFTADSVGILTCYSFQLKSRAELEGKREKEKRVSCLISILKQIFCGRCSFFQTVRKDVSMKKAYCWKTCPNG